MAVSTSTFYRLPQGRQSNEDRYLNHAIRDQKLWDNQTWCGLYFPHRALLLWILNFVALLGHVGIAVAVVVEGSKSYDALDFPVYTIVAEWHNINRDGFVYTIERSEFGRLSLTVVCGLFSSISALFHLIIVVATSRVSWCSWYYRAIGRCCMWWRWVEYTLSAPLMAIALLLISGIRDVTILSLVLSGQAVTMTCGFLVEIMAIPTYKTDYGWNLPLSYRLAPFWTGCLSMVPTWVVFIYSFYSNVAKGRERRDVDPPGWVQLIIWTEVVLFTSFTFPILWYQARHPKSYWKTELWYTILSLTAKLTLNGTLLAQVFVRGRLDLSSDDFTA